ncbi:MAG: cytochrome c oxidase subunit 3 [Actinomycetota bacterium]
MSTTANALGAGPKMIVRRPILVLAGLLSTVSAMVMGSMLAIWLDFRSNAPLRESTDGTKMLRDWLPENIKIPEVATNTMMMTFVITCVMAQWAIYSSRRNDSKHTSLALGVVLLTEIALINAQLAVYTQMGIGVRDGSYMTMFYAVTATMLAMIVVCTGFTLLALFRSIGGRSDDKDLVIAHAVYCYAISAIFSMLWLVVYVQK